ncbi:fucose mutarotase isoform X5 [Phacochoerus africanus]|uniref:fucose mutarotase isoform X5 n=1 Tax=Phacochoerus africanus TaxID=41426 RepID=UPI001FD97203|nr:fucose mutarotase isoform X5 [Phacochoerus africanus]
MVVLKGIPALLSPELLYALARMGHGDEIGAAPSPLPPPRRRWEGQWAWPNAPRLRGPTAAANGAGRSVLADVNFPTSSVCRCGPEEIRADGLGIPQLLEAVLTLLPLDTYVESPSSLTVIERFEFYERAKKAFAVVATGETALYGNLILKKGVLAPGALSQAC